MNKLNKGILIGMALGDGYLQVYKREYLTRVSKLPSSRIVSQIVLHHSEKQRDYLQHKVDILHKIFGGKKPVLVRREQFLKKTGKTYQMVKATKHNKYFRVLRRFMYPKGVKTYRREVLNFLNPQGLALWYQDDGWLKRNRNKEGKITSVNLGISTYCSEEEADIICDYFKEMWDIEFRKKYHKTFKKWVVTAPTKEAKKFMRLVFKWVHPSMSYKIDLI